jgi:hypothetical protein
LAGNTMFPRFHEVLWTPVANDHGVYPPRGEMWYVCVYECVIIRENGERSENVLISGEVSHLLEWGLFLSQFIFTLGTMLVVSKTHYHLVPRGGSVGFKTPLVSKQRADQPLSPVSRHFPNIWTSKHDRLKPRIFPNSLSSGCLLLCGSSAIIRADLPGWI